MNILKPKKTLVLITTISAVLIVYCLNPSLVSAAFFRIWETRGVPEEYGGSVIHGAYQKVATYGGFIYVATDGVSRGVSVSVLDGGTGQPVSPNGVPIQKFFPGIEISDMKFDSSGNLYIIGGDVGAHTTVYKTDPDLNVITSSVLSSTYLWDAHLEVFDDVIDLAGTNLDYNGTLLSLRPSDLSIISGPFIDSGNANGEHQILSIGKTGQLGGVESIFVLNSTDIFEVRNANNFSLVASMNIPGFVTGQQYYRTAFYDGSYIFLIYLNGAQTPYYEIRRIDLNSGTSCSAAGSLFIRIP